MPSNNKHAPAVITVKPTVIRIGQSEHRSIDDWHSRFTRTVTTATIMAIGTGLVSFALSYYDDTASFWLGIVGMLATGIAIYRELCRAGLIPGRIVGLSLAIAPIVLSCLFKLAPLPFIGPAHVAALGCGLLVGWAAHAAGLFSDTH